MTDNELLFAISNMIEPIKNDMQEIKGRMEVIENKVESIDNRVKNLEVKVKSIELTQENKVLPRLYTIESCYTSTYDRYKDSVEDYGMMKQDISILKKVVTEHSEKLQNIG